MNNKPNKAVLFDLDGTLIDTAPDMIYALKTVLKNNHTNTIILDAGVLSFLQKSIKEYSKLESEIVLTPHPGEASRLLDASVEELSLIHI